jgi:hypothetical protein
MFGRATGAVHKNIRALNQDREAHNQENNL